MSDDNPYVNLEDEPAATQASPYVSLEDENSPLKQMPDFKSESEYQTWVDQHRIPNTNQVKIGGDNDRTVTVDPYYNGVNVDLRRLYQNHAEENPVNGNKDVKADHDLLDQYALPGTVGFTPASVYAKGMDPTKLGFWDVDDNGQEVWRDPNYQPPSTTEKIMGKAKQLASDAYDTVASGDAFDPEKALDNAEGAAGSLVKGLGGSFNELGKGAATFAGAVPVLADQIKSLYTGQPDTTAQDWWFSNTVDKLQDRDSAFELAKGAGLPDKIAHGFGAAIGTISQAILTPELDVGDIATTVAGRVAQRVGAGAASMTIPATTAAVNTGRDVLERTGDEAAAVKAAAAQYLVTSASGAVPAAVGGGLPTRIASGAAIGAGQAEVSRQLTNAAMPEDMQTPYDVSQTAEGALLGGAFGALHGGESAAKPAAAAEDFADRVAAGSTKPSSGGLPPSGEAFDRYASYENYDAARAAAAKGDAQGFADAKAQAQRHADAAARYAEQHPEDTQAQADAKDAAQMASASFWERYADQAAGGEAPKGRASASAETNESPESTESDDSGRSAEQEEAVTKASVRADDAGEIRLLPAPDGQGAYIEVKGLPVAHFDDQAEAQTVVEAAQQRVDERRTDLAQRKRIDDMSPEEMKVEIARLRSERLTHPLTGIPNRRAYEESDKLPVQVSIDADSLKWVNDIGGHAAGDQVLKAIATALHEASPDNAYHAYHAYHLSGDEFTVQGADHDTVDRAIQQAKDRLAGAKVEFTGPNGDKITLNGIGFSHGKGTTLAEADANLQADKAARQQSGLRAARGEQPPGARSTPASEGLPAHEDHAAAQVIPPYPGQPKKPVWALPETKPAPRATEAPKPATTAPSGETASPYVKLEDEVPDRAVVPLRPKPNERTRGPSARKDSILQYLARHPRGLDREEAKRQGIDPADMGLPTAHVGIRRAFRKGGMTFDEAAETLHEEGYPVHGSDGRYDPNVLLDRIDDELRGKPHYSVHNEAHTERLAQQLRDDAAQQQEHEPETPALADEPQHIQDWTDLANQARKVDPDATEAALEKQDDDAAREALEEIIRRGMAGNEAPHQGASAAAGTGRGEAPLLESYTEAEVAQREAQAKARAEAEAEAERKATADKDRDQFALTGSERPSDANPRQTDLVGFTPQNTKVAGTVEGETFGHDTTGWDDHAKLINDLLDLKTQPGKRNATIAQGIQEDAQRLGQEDSPRGELIRDLSKMDPNDEESAWPIIERAHEYLNDYAQRRNEKAIPAAQREAKIEDVGEKIGGARKDRWAERGMNLDDLDSMPEGEAAQLVKKDAVWKPDWENLVENGVDKAAAAVAKVVWDKLGARPRNNTPEGRRYYIETLGAIRRIIEASKTMAEVRELQSKVMDAVGYDHNKDRYGQSTDPELVAARNKFWSVHKGRRSVLNPGSAEVAAAKKLIQAGFPGDRIPWQSRYAIYEARSETNQPEWRVYKKSGRMGVGVFPTEAQAIIAARDAYLKDKAEAPKGEGGKEPPPKRPHLDTIKREGLPPVREGNVKPEDLMRDYGFRGIEFGNWAANDERQKLVNLSYDALRDFADVMGLPPRALSLNGTMGLALGARGGGFGAAHYEPGKLVINLTKLSGAGSLAHEFGHALDHYFGEIGRPDAYKTDARGASGWYKDPKYSTWQHLRPEVRAAWEGVMTAIYKRQKSQAEVIRDAEIGLEKQMAALKQQEARLEDAKESPDRNFHRKLTDWIERERRLVKIRQGNLAKLRAGDPVPGLDQVMTPTGYLKASEALSGGKADGYWRRPTEMFARAFESWVEDKLHEKGALSQYLVHATTEPHMRRDKGDPYPRGEERTAINKAIQTLVDSLRVREEDGKSVVFEPTRGYNDKQLGLDFGGEPVKADFETRPDTTKKDVRRGVSALVGLRDLHAGATVLGDLIPRDFAARGTVSLVGQRIGNVHDLAVLQQANRRPDFEVLHLILTDRAGVVVHHTAVSSRLPGAAVFLLGKSKEQAYQYLRRTMREHGATGYWLSHNHPSGRSYPSTVADSGLGSDEAFTNFLAEKIPGFKGHVVVNSNEYSTLMKEPRANGVVMATRPISGQPWVVGQSMPRMPHPLLGQPLSSPKQLMTAMKSAGSETGGAHIFAVSGNGMTVRALTWFPRQLVDYRGTKSKMERLRMVARLRKVGIGAGGSQLFAIVDNQAMADSLPPIFRDVLVRGEIHSEVEKGRITNNSIVPNLGRSMPASYRVQEPAKGPTFYSAVERAVETAKREKGTGAEWEATLRNMPGVKKEELDWIGLPQWLEGRGRVTRDEVAEYVRAHKVELGEVTKLSGDAQPPLLQEHIDDINAQLRENDLGELTTEQEATLRRGGPDAEGMLRDLEARVGVSLDDIPVGGDPDASGTDVANYQNYATPGGTNYREKLLTLEPRAPRIPTFEEWYAQTHTGDINKIDETPYLREILESNYASQKRNLMQSNNFKSGHWQEPNVVAHTRYDDRVGPNGERLLHLHEVQADWHQLGRKFGYANESDARKREIVAQIHEKNMQLDAAANDVADVLRRLYWYDNSKSGAGLKGEDGPLRDALAILHNDRGRADWEKSRWESHRFPEDVIKAMKKWHAIDREITELRLAKDRIGDAVPDAPFKTTWPELVMKRMLREAVEGGYDALSWDTGDTNADRYNMSKEVDRIHVAHEDGSYHISASKNGRMVVERTATPENKLSELIGKDMATKAIAGKDNPEGVWFDGDDLKVGGAGMRAFYDQMLPQFMGKYVKKWGGKVERGDVLGDIPSNNISGEFGEIIEQPAGVIRTPAHMIRITPAMRESVMAGQAMFEPSDTYGTVSEPTGAYGVTRRAVASLVDNDVVMHIRQLVNPKDVSELSQRAAQTTSAFLGELAHQKEVVLQNLERFSRAVDKLSVDDQLDMIHAIETGTKQPIPEMQPVADELRKLFDTWRENVQGLGTGALENWIENYFPHIWADDKKAAIFAAQVQGRRPMRGPATFLKKRTIPTIREGMEYGLKPLSTNPLILTLLKVHEMQRFVSGVSMMQTYKESGLAKFFRTGRHEDGWVRINDAIAKVSQWSEEEQGFIERGYYAMPADAARIINNHLSASLLRNFAPAQVIRVGSNMLNALQLGFSAFHLGFTTMDAIVSKNALAIERLFHGEPLRAAAAFAEAATGPGAAVMNLRRGWQLMKAYSNPSGATPEMLQMVKALQAGGGRAHMDRYYQAAEGVSPFRGAGVRSLAADIRAAMARPQGQVAAMTKAIASFPVEMAQKTWNGLAEIVRIYPKLQVPFEIAGRITRASTAWIMEDVVPLQKLGVFSDLAADWFRRNPEGTPDEMTAAMQSIWRSVDNRLGEMVYDNLFWDRTLKDGLHLGVRAVGWNEGTVREIGGAPQDAIKALDALVQGDKQKAANHAHKIAYVLGLAMTQAIAGAVLQYLMCGEPPRDLKDLMFPRTGRKHQDGSEERLSLPSYVKDIYEYAHHPLTTIANKANPWISVTSQMLTNTDYFGDPITNPHNTSALEDWRDRALYVGKEMVPFGFQQHGQLEGAKEPGWVGDVFGAMPKVGLTSAPGYVTKPDQIASAQHYDEEKRWEKHLRIELSQAKRDNDQDKVHSIQQQLNDLKRSDARERQQYLYDKSHRGASSPSSNSAPAGETEAQRIRREAAERRANRTSSLTDKFGPMIDQGGGRAAIAQRVQQAGYPALAGLIRSIPAQLRPQVAAKLREYA